MVEEEEKLESEFIVELTEEEKAVFEKKRKRKEPELKEASEIKVGHAGPSLEDSGGFCMTEEKTVNIETSPGGDNFEIEKSTVNGIGLNVDYTDVPTYIDVTDAISEVMRLIKI